MSHLLGLDLWFEIGVRSTISPAMNTDRMANTSIRRGRRPRCRGWTGLHLPTIGTAPPPGVMLSWKQLTDPVEVPVVVAA
jgi:hypothetical protein